jgi:hypothetical protein
MSRSVRRPYSSATNYRSLVVDRRLANKGVRQAFRQALRRAADDYEDFLSPHRHFLSPHRLECSHNNVYAWDCDGLPWYQFDHVDRNWSRHCLCVLGNEHFQYSQYAQWPPKWMLEVTRK